MEQKKYDLVGRVCQKVHRNGLHLFLCLSVVRPPFVDPLGLNLFQMALAAVFPLSFKVRNLKNPVEQVSKANSVDL